MGLRNILLIVSVVIIGLCLSLYFQTNQELQTVNWEQYENLQLGAEREPSLADYNKKIAPYRLEALIREIFEKNRLQGQKTRIMELNPGNGRMLMELRKLFPEVELYGINREKTHNFYRRESFIPTGLKYELFNRDELRQIELPYVVFEDLDFGGRIPYDENKFDLIYSRETIGKIKYKFELFNEIMRVLRPGGLSLHTDVTGIKIYSRGVILDVRDALAELRRRGIEINLLESRDTLRFRKPEYTVVFPVSPHQELPGSTQNLPLELKRPDMGYNLRD
jgi:SAM-dependent methyltransferase